MIVYLYRCATCRHLVLEKAMACARCGSDRLVPLDWKERDRAKNAPLPETAREPPSRAELESQVAKPLPTTWTSQGRRFEIERQLAIERRERDERPARESMSKNREKFVECRTCHMRELTIPHDNHSEKSATRRLIERCPLRPKLCSVLLDSGSGDGGMF